MKALSIIHPWASLIASGEKTIETRSWTTRYRGLIAIHASRLTEDAAETCCEQLYADLLVRHGYTLPDHPPFGELAPGTIPFGAIVAVATLADVLPTHSLRVSEQERSLGDFSAGRYGWVLHNIVRLGKPIPCRGRPGLWDVPGQHHTPLLAQIEAR